MCRVKVIVLLACVRLAASSANGSVVTWGNDNVQHIYSTSVESQSPSSEPSPAERSPSKLSALDPLFWNPSQIKPSPIKLSLFKPFKSLPVKPLPFKPSPFKSSSFKHPPFKPPPSNSSPDKPSPSNSSLSTMGVRNGGGHMDALLVQKQHNENLKQVKLEEIAAMKSCYKMAVKKGKTDTNLSWGIARLPIELLEPARVERICDEVPRSTDEDHAHSTVASISSQGSLAAPDGGQNGNEWFVPAENTSDSSTA